ncbi:MAG TPA: YdeI/OmpD-associated family protein [Candidatus Angelobacter sp.]|nr:YdeI/OmpD-associated family protein [Candidatus Angelobacter sp.]
MRPVPPCPELARELRQSKRLQKFFGSLEDYQRIWIMDGILAAKRDDTRKRRAQRAAEFLMEVMEAEIDPPPALKIALARSPKARRAWEARDLHYRRTSLLRLFERRGLEARRKALSRLIEELELSADRVSVLA